MLDYQSIAALAAVVENQGFQNAAQKLFITQSAVSQRIKALENFYGEPVLIRTPPYRPTLLGLILLKHYNRICLLEDDLNETLLGQAHTQHISIALSRDGLETWFTTVIDRLRSIPALQLEIIADDQGITLDYLQNGLVSACASTTAKALSGCKSEFLGYFDYVLVASPQFKATYFKSKNMRANLAQAPAIIFDNKDTLHKNYLQHFFNMDDKEISYNVVPSVAGFRQFAVNGYAYALIPEIDIIDELKQGKLVKICPEKTWQMPVFWHSWLIEAKPYKLFNELVLMTGRRILRNT